MGKKMYKLIQLLDASRIILGDKRSFGKDKEIYEALHKGLEEDWRKRHSVPVEERITEFRVGEYVLVKSIKCDGYRRAIILDVNGNNTSLQERSYSVYLYDDGSLEEVDEKRVTVLTEIRRQQLLPRTVIVRLTGMVPAKIVVDLAKKALKVADDDEDPPYILTQDSSWSNNSKRQVSAWLKHPDVKYLGIVIDKTMEDGSVFGDIYRRMRTRAGEAEGGEKDQPIGGKQGKEKHYLIEYILSENLGLRNDDLYVSQLKLRDLPQVPQEKEASAKAKVIYEGKYNDEVLAASRQSIDSPESNSIQNKSKPKEKTSDISTSKATSEGKYNDELLTASRKFIDSPESNSIWGQSKPKEKTSDIFTPTVTYEGKYSDEVLAASRQSIDSHDSDSSRSKSKPKKNTSDISNSSPIYVHDPPRSEHSSELSIGASAQGTPPIRPSSSGKPNARYVISSGTDPSVKNSVNIPGLLLARYRWMRAPYTKIEELQLDRDIIKALEALGIADLSELHKTVIPNFIRGSDLMVISPDGGTQLGKNRRSLCYLLPQFRTVFEKYKSKTNVGHTDPPESIIIVNSHNAGVNLESCICQILSYSHYLSMRVKFVSKGGDDEASSSKNSQYHYKGRMIPGGVSIMIMTMPYLAAVMQTREGPFLFEKLRFLTFEDTELYLKNYKEEILTFIGAAIENSKVSPTGVPLQLAFCGSKWTAEMEVMYKELVQLKGRRPPMVTVAGANQALRYAKIQWKVHYVQKEQARMQKLRDLLQTDCLEGHKHVVIACSTSAIAITACEEVHKVIGGAQVQTIVSDIGPQDLAHALNLWRKNTLTIFIISDDMMRHVGITDATCIIFYDSPIPQVERGHKRSVAAERFGYLWSNIRDIEMEYAPASTNSLEISKPPDLVAHFLMTGEEDNFYQMYRFGSSIGDCVDFPSELKSIAAMLERDGLANVSMCQGIRLYGFCNQEKADTGSCPYRHSFSKAELSSNPTAPLTGEIEVRIVKCENPSYYKAELMRHFVFENGKRICNYSYINESRRRRMELEKFYGTSSSGDQTSDQQIQPLQNFKEGTWCAVKFIGTDTEYYERAILERILQRDKLGCPLIFRVNCIDSGMILIPSASQLFELPEKFQQWSPLVVNLILSNLKPKRGESEYRQSHEKKVRTLTVDKIFNAKIWLSVCDTIWVNPMVEYHIDSTTGKPYRGISVRLELIRQNIAEFNGSHLEVLMESVNNHPEVYKGITSTEELRVGGDHSISHDELLMAKEEFHQIGDEIRWAFVEKSTRNIDPAKIVTQFAYDPWTFFGVHDKHYDQQKSLEKELNKCIEKYIDENGEDHRFSKYTKIFNDDFYQVGMVVAARERESQDWMRGLIMQKHAWVEDDSKNIKKVVFEVFFVDYGDSCFDMTVEELFPIPQKFVSLMPFQIIAFKLDHIQPAAGEENWSKEANEAFLDIVVKDQLSIDIELVAFSDADSNHRTSLPCRYYNAVAFYKNDELGSCMIENGMAEWKPGKENVVNEVKQKILNFYNAAVDQALGNTDDDDAEERGNIDSGLDSDMFDANIEESEILDIMDLRPRQNGIRLPELDVSTSNLGEETGNGSQEVSALEVGPIPSSSCNDPSLTQAVPKMKQTSPPESSGAPCTASVSNDGLLHPQVLWHETKDFITLTINLTDIRKYVLEILDDLSTVQFETLDKCPNYGFKIKLYGKVRKEYDLHPTGMCLRIRLAKKMTGRKWPRLLYSINQKYQWLKSDLDRIDSGEDEDNEIDQEDDTINLPAEEGARPEEGDFSDPENLTVDDEEEDEDEISAEEFYFRAAGSSSMKN